MRLLLTLILLVISNVTHASTCEVNRQYDETVNKFQVVRVCWDETAPDWKIGSTVIETVLNNAECIFHYETKNKWSGERAAHYCMGEL